MNTDISSVLSKQMTRIEFLKYLGIISISVFGIPTLLKNLSVLDPKKPVKQVSSNLPAGKAGRTFGSGAYGV